ncbi:DNA polymerase epsilon subunit B like [Quillaja saponaria]|uniref:DNA polymerase epsilon subunit B like n=1 Tax=Quillaja saponaria TaxID=32244 RepID=A0AAD7LB89_QUISA|nr:DNA polymerase epsilon subunit B like [Quillaja saponaria]
MEVAMEVEDDLFFADLSKQISLLIMEEDEEDPVSHCPAVSLQDFSRAIHPPAQSFFLYQEADRRESKGTGVFIPQTTQPRRKHKQLGRATSYYTKSHRQHEDTRMVSQVSNNYSFKPRKA